MNQNLSTTNNKIKEAQYQVLLVEDDLAHEKLISRSFEAHEQYELVTRHTLSDACNMLVHFSPDLIITDFRLPDGNDIDLLEQFLQIKTWIISII